MPMYDVRCTMYDLGSSRALRGIWQSKCGRDVMELCAGVVRKGRWQTRSAYVRWTMYDVRFGNSRACARIWRSRGRLTAPMYDVRRTMYDLGSSRALRGIWQSKCGRDVMELCAGVVRKGRGRLAAPMYDVRFGIMRSRAAGGWRRLCTI